MAAGRPTKWRPEFSRFARIFAEKQAATDAELADFFGVTVTTINKWKLIHPEFALSIKEGKEEPNRKVERSLFERATGSSHPETKVLMADGTPVRIEIEKFYPPDTAAAFIWLKNRDPERWRDKHEVDHTGTVNLKIDSDDDNL